MKEVEPGRWETSVSLQSGKYEYKFLVNGSTWVADRDNPAVTSDGWGNSILVIDEKQQIQFLVAGISEKYPSFLYSHTRAGESPDWVRDSVIYELFPRAYTPEGFRGLVRKLDYLTNLGVDTVWLMPIFPIGQKNRKGSLGSPYSVRDYYAVNPEFGTKEDFRVLVEAAHQRGMKVILDWVPNHSAWDNPLLKQHPEFYLKDAQGRIVVPPDTDWTDVAQFDYRNAGMQDYMIEALKYWVKEFGVDGYRMDVAGRIPHSFWDRLRRELDTLQPGILLLAESEEPEHHLHGFDLTYAGAVKGVVRNIARSSQTQYDFHQVYNRQKYNFPQGSLRMHWMENHDQEHALRQFGPQAIYPGAVIHLTLDGVPLIHMGQEFADDRWMDWRSLFDALQLNWEAADQDLLAHYRALIRLRKEHAPLRRGELLLLENNREKVVSYVRRYEGQSILVLVNLSSKEQIVKLNPAQAKKYAVKLKPGQTGLGFTPQGRQELTYQKELRLAPWQSVLYFLD